MALAYGSMPNVSGAVDPNVTQANIHQTICVPGYSTKIRPPQAYTGALKKKQMKAQHITGTMTVWEEDHLVPLSVGGSPTSEQNLWLETRTGPWGAAAKDRLEVRMHSLVCKDQVPLATAQQAFESNWISAYQQYVSITPHYTKHKHRKKSWLRYF